MTLNTNLKYLTWKLCRYKFSKYKTIFADKECNFSEKLFLLEKFESRCILYNIGILLGKKPQVL